MTDIKLHKRGKVSCNETQVREDCVDMKNVDCEFGMGVCTACSL